LKDFLLFEKQTNYQFVSDIFVQITNMHNSHRLHFAEILHYKTSSDMGNLTHHQFQDFKNALSFTSVSSLLFNTYFPWSREEARFLFFLVFFIYHPLIEF